MAMHALVSKLRFPAAASRRTLPPFRSSSTAPQDKLGSSTWRSTTKESSPLADHENIGEIFARAVSTHC